MAVCGEESSLHLALLEATKEQLMELQNALIATQQDLSESRRQEESLKRQLTLSRDSAAEDVTGRTAMKTQEEAPDAKLQSGGEDGETTLHKQDAERMASETEVGTSSSREMPMAADAPDRSLGGGRESTTRELVRVNQKLKMAVEEYAALLRRELELQASVVSLESLLVAAKQEASAHQNEMEYCLQDAEEKAAEEAIQEEAEQQATVKRTQVALVSSQEKDSKAWAEARWRLQTAERTLRDQEAEVRALVEEPCAKDAFIHPEGGSYQKVAEKIQPILADPLQVTHELLDVNEQHIRAFKAALELVQRRQAEQPEEQLESSEAEARSAELQEVRRRGEEREAELQRVIEQLKSERVAEQKAQTQQRESEEIRQAWRIAELARMESEFELARQEATRTPTIELEKQMEELTKMRQLVQQTKEQAAADKVASRWLARSLAKEEEARKKKEEELNNTTVLTSNMLISNWKPTRWKEAAQAALQGPR
eukprot:gene16642-19769_t